MFGANGGGQSRSTLAEDFRAMGVDPGTLRPLNEGAPRRGAKRRSRREDVQVTGHGTSYPTPGSEIETGVREPDDEGHTNPDSAGQSNKLESLRLGNRLSALREDDVDGDGDEDSEVEDDEVEPAVESDEEGDDEEDDVTEDSDRGSEEPTTDLPPPNGAERTERRRARAESDDADDGKDPEEEDDDETPEGMPPEKVSVESVVIRLPKGKAKMAESRQYSAAISRKIIGRLSGMQVVESKRKKRAQMLESHMRKAGIKTVRGGSVMSEVRELIEGARNPTSTFDDHVEALNSLANIDEALVVRWGQMERRFDAAPLGRGVSFKKLAEAALTRAHVACGLLNEMSKMRARRLNSMQHKYLSEQVNRLGREQLLSFHALGDTLASVGRYSSIYDMPGINEDTEEPISAELPHESDYENPAELGDVPPAESRSRRRRARTEGAETDPPEGTEVNDQGGLEFSGEARARRRRSRSEDLDRVNIDDVEGDTDDTVPEDDDLDVPAEMDDTDNDPTVSAYAEMDRDELVREAVRMRAELRKMRERRMGEDGRMPTDFVRSSTGENRAPRPRRAPRARG